MHLFPEHKSVSNGGLYDVLNLEGASREGNCIKIVCFVSVAILNCLPGCKRL